MSEPREMYDRSLKMNALRSAVTMMERHIHHELDNFEMDMSPELQSVLKDLEKAIRVAGKEIAKINDKNN